MVLCGPCLHWHYRSDPEGLACSWDKWKLEEKMLRWVDRYNRTLPVEQKLNCKQWHGKMQVCDLRKVSTSSSDENSKRIFLYSDSPSSCGATLLEQIQLQVANVRKERNKNGNTRTAKLVFGHFTLHISQWGLIFPPRGKGVTAHFSEVQIAGGYLGRFTFFQSQFTSSCSNSGGDVAWRWLDVTWRRSQQPTLSSLCALALLPETNIMQVFVVVKMQNFLAICSGSLKFWSTFNSKQQLLQHTQLTPPRNLGAFRVFQWVGHNIGIEPAKTGSQWVGVASNKEARGRFQRTAPPPLFLPGKQWNWIRKGFPPSVCAGSTRSPAIQEPLQLRAHVAAAA